MNGKQLKNSILQWAIQGKLVPQDPNDEPTSVLLERIRKEKERLVKEKKIKKDKNASIIFRGEDNSYYEKIIATGEVKCIDEEIPFEIPNGWEWCRLGNIGIAETGTTPNKTHPEYFGRAIPFIGPANILEDRIYCITQGLSEEGKQYGRIVPTNSILQVCIGGSIGKCAINKQPITFNQQINSITPIFCDSAYVHLVLQSETFRLWIMDKATGTATPIINRSNWESLFFPCPPLNEQKRIVCKYLSVKHLIDKYKLTQENLNNLNRTLRIKIQKSILQEAIQGKLVPQVTEEGTAQELLEQIMFEKQKLVKEGKLKKSVFNHSIIYKGDDNKYYEQIGGKVNDITDEMPFEIPDTWAWARIGILFAHNNGKQLNKSNSSGRFMEYITTSNLYWDGFKLDNLKKMPFEKEEIERCQAIKGDLLVCEGGDVGRACIWEYDFPIMLQNHIHKLRAYYPLCTKYFYYIFYLYNKIGIIGGKGIGIQGFSAKALHNTLIPLPPLNEQKRICNRISELFGKIKA